MRRVLEIFTADLDGKRAAEQLVGDMAKLTTNLGHGATHGVYVDRTLPKGHPKRRFAPWAVFISDRKSVLRNKELTES
jgi:hypothetical protein